MKKTDKKSFIDKLLEDETFSKSANVKAFMFMKNSETIKVTDERLERIHKCGNIIKYAINESEEKKKLLYTETCDSRFCSRCQKMKSIKTGQKIFTITNYLKEEKDYDFIFITLTVPNVPGDKLKEENRKINKAIDKLMQRKAYNSNVIKAFITKIEVTYNRNRNDYHPHIHILAAVNKEYFKQSNRDYISHEKLLKDWQECKNDHSISQVNIKKLKGDNEPELMKSILEISKYESKSAEYTLNQKVFETYYHALKGAQLMRYNREYKDLALIYDIDKFGLFDEYRLKVDEQGNFTSKLIGVWNFKYKEYEKYFDELTPEEIEYLNKKTEYTSYKLFSKKKMKLQSENIENKAIVRDIEIKLAEQISKPKTRKSTIQNTKSKLTKAKRKYSDTNSLYRLYDIIDSDFKNKFVKLN